MRNVPTMAIDPDGQWVAELIAGIIATGVAIYEGVQYKEAGMNFWEGFAMSSAQSPANYIAGGFVGTIFSSGSGILSEIGRAAAHGATQGGVSAAFGGDFWSSAAAGAFSSAAGSGMQALNVSGGGMVAGSAAVGGVSTGIAGGDFWSGAATGAIVATANHLQHQQNKTEPTIFINKYSNAEDLNINEFMSQLKARLAHNGFSRNLKIMEYSFWENWNSNCNNYI